MSVNGRNWVAQGSMLSAGVLLVGALVGIVNYLGMRYYHRFDWTSSQIYSLSEKTLSILAGLDRDIDVTLFLRDDSPLYESSKELLGRYAAKSPRVRFRTVSVDKNLIEAQRLVDKLATMGPDCGRAAREQGRAQHQDCHSDRSTCNPHIRSSPCRNSASPIASSIC